MTESLGSILVMPTVVCGGLALVLLLIFGDSASASLAGLVGFWTFTVASRAWRSRGSSSLASGVRPLQLERNQTLT